MSIENFADHPESIAERRSEIAKKGSAWTPRDVLIHLLRQIDKGEINIETLVVCFQAINDDNMRCAPDWLQASPTAAHTIGVLEVCKYSMMETMYQ